MRWEKIREVRARVEAGDYDDPKRMLTMLDACLDSVLADLGSRMPARSKNQLTETFQRDLPARRFIGRSRQQPSTEGISREDGNCGRGRLYAAAGRG